MTLIDDILEQAKQLSPAERIELMNRLAEMREENPSPESVEPDFHWGRNLVRMIEELGPVELIYPEIEDPVEWVARIREDQRQQRLNSAGEE